MGELVKDEPPQSPEEQDPLAGMPTQDTFDRNALREALAQSRAALATTKVNWHIAQTVGVEGIHPQRVKDDIGKLVKQTELLEAILVSGQLPMPPKLEIATSLIAPAVPTDVA